MRTFVHKRKLICLFIIFIQLIFTYSVFGASFTSAATGNWNLPSTWNVQIGTGSGKDADGIPDADDDITISSGHTVTVNVAGAANSISVNGVLNILNDLTVSNKGSVTVNNGGTLSFNSTAAIKGGSTSSNGVSVLINNGATLITANSNGFSKTASGSFLRNPGTLTQTFSANANYTYNGTSSQVTGDALTGANELKINNSAGVTLSSAVTVSALTIGDVVTNSIFNDGGFQLTSSGTLHLNSGTFKLSGTTAFPGFSTRNISNGTTIEYAGANQIISATPLYQNLAISGGGTKTLNGSVSISGNLSIGSATTLDISASNYALSVGGNWTNNGTFTPGSSTVTFNGTSGQVIGGSATSHTFNNVIVNKSAGTLSINGSTTSLNVKDLTLSLGSFSAPSILIITGNFQLSTGGFTAGTGSVNFNGTSAQTITGNTTFNTLKINNAAGVTLTSPVTVSTLTIGDVVANSILNDGGNQITCNNGTLNLNNASTFKLGKLTATTFPLFSSSNLSAGSTVEYAAGVAQNVSSTPIYQHIVFSGNGTKTLASDTLRIQGNWTNHDSIIPGSNTVAFIGSSVQAIGGTSTSTFNNFVLNNNAGVSLSQNITINGILTQKLGSIAVGNHAMDVANYAISTSTPLIEETRSAVTVRNLTISNDVTLNNDIYVTTKLNLNSGKVSIAPGHKMILPSTDAIVGSGYGPSKHIATKSNNGVRGVLLVKGVSSAGFTFPIGDGTNYLPVTVKSGDNTKNIDVEVSVFKGITANGQPNGAPMLTNDKDNSVDVVWDIKGVNGVATTISIPWDRQDLSQADLEGNVFKSVANSSIGISHYTNGAWDAAAGVYDPNTKTFTRTGITSFSPFTLWTYSSTNSVLPVNFSNIKASERSSGVQVEFTNATESEVEYYEIERSSDGRTFKTIKRLEPAKNNYNSASYKWIDATAVSGRNIYRIKAVEVTGKIVLSGLVSITLGIINSEVKVYAQSGQMSFQANELPPGNYQVNLINMAGQILVKDRFSHSGGSFSQTTPLSNIKPGMYILTVNGPLQVQKKFSVQ